MQVAKCYTQMKLGKYFDVDEVLENKYSFSASFEKNDSNLTEKHMLEFRERKMFSVQMTFDSMYFSLFPSEVVNM